MSLKQSEMDKVFKASAGKVSGAAVVQATDVLEDEFSVTSYAGSIKLTDLKDTASVFRCDNMSNKAFTLGATTFTAYKTQRSGTTDVVHLLSADKKTRALTIRDDAFARSQYPQDGSPAVVVATGFASIGETDFILLVQDIYRKAL